MKFMGEAPPKRLEKGTNMEMGAVILSRYSSTRLPGKALLEIAGKPILNYIVERLLQVLDKKHIVIATSEDASDDPIAAFSERNGITCFRGSLENVSERFYLAAAGQNWDYAIRINGDNVFVDTELLRYMVEITGKGEYDFVSNVKDRTYPKGMSIELVRVSFYKSLLEKMNGSEKYREHVTLYLYDHACGNFHFCYNEALPEAAGIQMALDTWEDFIQIRQIIAQFTQAHWNYNLKEIYHIWKKSTHGSAL